MKKYLITAAMAVAVSGALVSCHEDEITGSTVERKIQAFETLFTQAFGKPAPNHTFGFGAPIVLEGAVEGAVTRSQDINGNLWETCPIVTEKEAIAVYNYVNKVKTSIPRYFEESPVDMKNFFVTQVWGGRSTNSDIVAAWGGQTDPKCRYTDYAGGSVFGPEKMNHLQISKSETRLDPNGQLAANSGNNAINGDWDHAYNFNASQNINYNGNTMFLNWGTQNFAYHNSNDSKYHDKWIIVDGADIYDSDGNNYPGKFYVCFDFISITSVKTIIGLRVPGINPGEWTDVSGSGVVKIEGNYTSIDEIPADKRSFTYNGTNYTIGEGDNLQWYIKDHEGNTNMSVDANEYYTDWIVRLVEADPKGGKTAPQVKVISGSITTDGYVTKKIVSGEKVMKSGRIFCEDIVSADSKYALEDLDYNDVVYDAAIINKYRKLVTTYLDKDRNPIIENGAPKQIIKYDFDISGQANGYNSLYAIVRLLAAGGTMPIAINILPKQFNADVHNVLGQTSTTIMINTLDEGEREKVNMAAVASPVPAEDLKKETGEEREKFYNVNDLDNGIELYVEYGNIAAGIRSKYYDDETGDVVASAKYMVPLGTPWAKERVKITNAYPKFNEWIADESVKFWEHPALDENNSIDKSLFYDYDGKKVVGLDPVLYAEGKIISNNGKEEETDLGEEEITSGGTTESLVDATNKVMTTPSGTKIYDYKTSGEGYLYSGSGGSVTINTTITAGSKIRVYGVSIDGWEVTCNNQTKSASNGGNYSTNGFVEFDVTSNIGNSLVITGKNFTVTYVTVIGSTPTTQTTQTFWENTSTIPVTEYNNHYRFAVEGHGSNECLATFSSDVWNRIKTSTFYLVVRGANPAIRVTNGWWDATWPQDKFDFVRGNSLLTDNGNGTWTLKINLANTALVGTIDEKHLLFSGNGYTPVKLYFQ